MLSYQILENENIVVIEPKGVLSKADFFNLTKDVDLYLLRTGILNGVLIYATNFVRWDSFGAMITHLRFIRDYQRLIKKVPVVSDSVMASIMPKLVDHFVSAEVKGFAFDDKNEAMAWLKSSN
jgi:hypothetical protein